MLTSGKNIQYEVLHVFLSLLKVWWQLPLFLFILSFSHIHNHIHTVHSFIHLHSPLSPLLVCSKRKNYPGVPSGDLNSGLPYSRPANYQPRCTLQNHAASYRTTLHPTEPRCTLPSHTAPYWAKLHLNWATLHPTEPRCTLQNHAAPCWATLHPTEPSCTLTEPRCTLLSHTAPYLATLHPAEPHCTILSHAAPCRATLHPTEPRCTLLSHAMHPNRSTLHPMLVNYFLQVLNISFKKTSPAPPPPMTGCQTDENFNFMPLGLPPCPPPPTLPLSPTSPLTLLHSDEEKFVQIWSCKSYFTQIRTYTQLWLKGWALNLSRIWRKLLLIEDNQKVCFLIVFSERLAASVSVQLSWGGGAHVYIQLLDLVRRHRDRRPSTAACPGCWAMRTKKVRQCAVWKIKFCMGLTRAA